MVRPGRFGFVGSVISPEDLEREVEAAMGEFSDRELKETVTAEANEFEPESIVKGKVVRVLGDEVVVDISYKSEGYIPLFEFQDDDVPDPGTEIEVFLEEMDEETGHLLLSKRKADRIRGWERVMSEHEVDDVIVGRAMRKIKGGRQ
jgi:small subunit ribosomal protein S1